MLKFYEREEKRFTRLKTNECLIAPYGKEEKYTTNKDIEETIEEIPENPEEPIYNTNLSWYNGIEFNER